MKGIKKGVTTMKSRRAFLAGHPLGLPLLPYIYPSLSSM
jgi:hypothetical protein